MTPIYNERGENIESRRIQFRDMKDESMNSVSEESIDEINLDNIFSVGTLNKCDSSSIMSIEFDSILSLRTPYTMEVGYMCSKENVSNIWMDCMQGGFE